MKRIFKIIAILIVLIAVSALAGLGIMALWNSVVTTICGFMAITFIQGVGLFLLGQLLSSGFIIPLFLGFGSLHAIHRHPGGDITFTKTLCSQVSAQPISQSI